MAPGVQDFVSERTPLGKKRAEMFAIARVCCNNKLTEGRGPLAAAPRIEEQIVCQECIQIRIEIASHDGELAQRDLVHQRFDHKIQADKGIVPVVRDEKPLNSLPHSLPFPTSFPLPPLCLTERSRRIPKIELLRAVRNALDPTQLIGGLECCTIADVARRRQLLKICGHHLKAVDEIAGRR